MISNSLPLVYIVILNWNGKVDTLECLESVQAIDYPNFVTVVVDNGSADGSEQAIRDAFPNITVLQTGANLGYAEGNNVGIRHAVRCGACYVFVINNDTKVDRGILTSLVTTAENHPNAAILGPKIYFYDSPDIINSAGGSLDEITLERKQLGFGQIDDGRIFSSITSVDWTTGCAMLLRVDALNEVGLFDPRFFLICEELDFCSRIRNHGYEIFFVPEAKLWHKVSAAFEGNYSPVYCYYMFRNILLYASKHRGTGRLSLYRALVKQSRDFFFELKEKGDRDYRKKGLCILFGTFHFFIGRYGRGPTWLFKFPVPRSKTLAELNAGKDLFKASIGAGNGEIEGRKGSTLRLPVQVTNLSDGTWPAFSSDAVRLSYHVRDRHGRTIVWDGTRTLLPQNLRSGKRIDLTAVVALPDQTGEYLLEWDLVQETVAWFSSKGFETAKCKVTVT